MAAAPPAILPGKPLTFNLWVQRWTSRYGIVGQARRLPVQGKASGSACPARLELLFERQLDSFVYPRGKVIFVDHARAGVPAQQGIVIAGRANHFRLFEPIP